MTENANLPSASDLAKAAAAIGTPAAQPEPKAGTAKKASAKAGVVTLTKEELTELLTSATTAAVQAVAGTVRGGKKKAAKKTAAKKSDVAAKRAQLKDANDAKRAAQAEATGLSVDEIKEAWKAAHQFATLDQTAYKTRYDEKLEELIGVRRFAA